MTKMAEINPEVERLYLSYKDRVYYYIKSKVNSVEDAEDILSEVFIKAGRFYDSYDGQKSSELTWMYSIARNAVIDFYRRQKESEELPEDLPLNFDIEEEAIEEETLERLAIALENMAPELRELIVLRYYNGFSLTEISGKMDISYGRIKLMHQKALAQLKKKLA